MPTRERLAKAEGGFDISGIGTRRVVRMLDAPLQQLRARAQINETQYGILDRLRRHWTLGHWIGSLQAVDLNRVRSQRHDGEFTSNELWHRERFEAGYSALERIERTVVALVALEERSINEAGGVLGYGSPYRGRQAALECLRSGAGKIMSAWLTMDRT
jgi:hypothetical protein